MVSLSLLSALSDEINKRRAPGCDVLTRGCLVRSDTSHKLLAGNIKVGKPGKTVQCYDQPVNNTALILTFLTTTLLFTSHHLHRHHHHINNILKRFSYKSSGFTCGNTMERHRGGSSSTLSHLWCSELYL